MQMPMLCCSALLYAMLCYTVFHARDLLLHLAMTWTRHTKWQKISIAELTCPRVPACTLVSGLMNTMQRTPLCRIPRLKRHLVSGASFKASESVNITADVLWNAFTGVWSYRPLLPQIDGKTGLHRSMSNIWHLRETADLVANMCCFT